MDHYDTSVALDGRVHPLTLWDFSGNEDYIRLREHSYPETVSQKMLTVSIHAKYQILFRERVEYELDFSSDLILDIANFDHRFGFETNWADFVTSIFCS